MKYTRIEQKPNMTVQYVAPLDERIVRFALTSDLSPVSEPLRDSELELYADLVQSGTKRKSKDEIFAYLDKHGIKLDVRAGEGRITFSVSAIRSKLPQALSLLSELLFEPRSDKTEFVNARARALEGVRENRDNASLIAHLNFLRELYPRTHARRPESLDEQKKTLETLKEKDFMRMHDAVKGGAWQGTAIVAKDGERAFNSFFRSFRDLTPSPVRLADDGVRMQTAKRTFETVPGRTNVELRIGGRLALTRDDADFAAFALGLDVLGHPGGFSGRLMSTVREKEGLTYGIYARLMETARSTSGYWFIGTFFTAKDLSRGIASTMRELHSIVAKGITEAELTTFKEMERSEYLIAHESNARRLKLYHGLLLAGCDETWLAELRETRRALTKKDVNTALRRHIDQSALTVSGAGPVNKKGEGII